jgi:hypothetical protein
MLNGQMPTMEIYILEKGGLDKTGIIYEPVAPFYEEAICPGELLVLNCESSPIVLDMATPPGGVYSGAHVTYNSTTDEYLFTPDCQDLGSFAITYTYDDSGCITSCTFMIAVFDSEAPVSTLGSLNSNATTITIPITAVNFTDVLSGNLRFLYDPAVITPVSASIGPEMEGTITTDFSESGVVTLQWSNASAVSISDNQVVFYITFTRISGGTSLLLWDNTNPDNCYWKDAYQNTLDDIPKEDYYINGSLQPLEAPATVAPQLTASPGTTIDVPISIRDFNNVGGFLLTMHFNPAALTYQSFTNNSGFPGMSINIPEPGVITAEGAVPSGATSGINLNDDDVLYTLTFSYINGFSQLDWHDDGGSCAYYEWPGNEPMLDTPQFQFYINGYVESDAPAIDWIWENNNGNNLWHDGGNWNKGITLHSGSGRKDHH